MHCSNYFKLNIKGHSDIDFVDVSLETDTKLFIDPYLIESINDKFSKDCKKTINSFFDAVFECCKTNDVTRLITLLDFGHEPNETKLGLSRNQSSGRGASSKILLKVFKTIMDENLLKNQLIKNPMDVCLFIKNFSEDRMSDLLTNILRKNLYEFTKEQCLKHNISLENNIEEIGDYWDINTLAWEKLTDYPLKAKGKMLLLTPKIFIRSKYIYSVGQYLRHKILVERQEYHLINKTGLSKEKVDKHGNKTIVKPSKKEIYEKEIKGNNHKDFIKNYAHKSPKSLIEFRDFIYKKVLSNEMILSDETLDIIVYKKVASKAS